MSPAGRISVGVGVGDEAGAALRDPYCIPAQIATAEMMPTGIPQNKMDDQVSFRSDMRLQRSHQQTVVSPIRNTLIENCPLRLALYGISCHQ